MPTNNPKPIKARIGFTSKLKCFPEILLNAGNANCTNANAMNNAKNVISN